jgi:hypothetical protein
MFLFSRNDLFLTWATQLPLAPPQKRRRQGNRDFPLFYAILGRVSTLKGEDEKLC